jgi:hypothetical protein
VSPQYLPKGSSTYFHHVASRRVFPPHNSIPHPQGSHCCLIACLIACPSQTMEVSVMKGLELIT